MRCFSRTNIIGNRVSKVFIEGMIKCYRRKGKRPLRLPWEQLFHECAHSAIVGSREDR